MQQLTPQLTPSADLIGLDVWPASVALCTYLAAHPGLVAGAAVCELGAGGLLAWLQGVLRELLLGWHACGCRAGGVSFGPRTSTRAQRPACTGPGLAGTPCSHRVPLPLLLLPLTRAGMGLPGLLCAKLAAQHVLLTDYEPMVVARIQQNAELNAVAARCACLALDWFNLAPLAPEQRHAFDLLLLADVIYAAAVVGPLVATLCTLLRSQTGAWQGRAWGACSSRAHLLQLHASAGWSLDRAVAPRCQCARAPRLPCRCGAGGAPNPAAADL